MMELQQPMEAAPIREQGEPGPSHSSINWLELPSETLNKIFNKCPPRVLAVLSCVNRGFRRAVQDADAWNTAVARFSGPDGMPAQAVRKCGLPAHTLYRELHTLQSARWVQLRLQAGPRPQPREHFSLNYLANGWLCMFGGLNHTGSQYFNDLWLLDAKSDPSGPRWHQLSVGSERPHPRAYHFAGVVHGRILIIHGGLFPQGYRMNDTWRIDLGKPTPQWEQLGHFVLDDNFGMVPGRPIPRFHHTAALVGRNLVIFGGHNYRRDEMQDTWVLDVMASALQPWLPIIGTGPQRRAYQASSVLQVLGVHGTMREMLFMHGGMSADGHLLNDCWMLDLDPTDPGWRLVHQQRKPVNSGPDIMGSSGGTSNGNNKPNAKNGSNENASDGKDGGGNGGSGERGGPKSNGRGAPNEPIALIEEDDVEEGSISDLITKTDSAAPARLEGTLGSPNSNVHAVSGRSSRSVLGAVRREEPPAPRERHMCCPVNALAGSDETARTPSVCILGGMSGSSSFKGLFLGMAGNHVLPPQPHVLVLHGLTKVAEVSGDTGSASSGQNSGASTERYRSNTKQASSSQHGQHKTVLKEASGVQDQSAAVSRAILRSRPKGFWLHVPRTLGPQPAQQNAASLLHPGSPRHLYGGLPLPLGPPEEMPRRESTCLRLRTGHVILFGGNDGRLTDVFGDGDHQYGLDDTLIVDLEALQEICRFPRLFSEDMGPVNGTSNNGGNNGVDGGSGAREASGEGTRGNGSSRADKHGNSSEAANMSSAAQLATAAAVSPITGLVVSGVLSGRSEGALHGALRSAGAHGGGGGGEGGAKAKQGQGQGSDGSRGHQGSADGQQGSGSAGRNESGQGSGGGSGNGGQGSGHGSALDKATNNNPNNNNHNGGGFAPLPLLTSPAPNHPPIVPLPLPLPPLTTNVIPGPPGGFGAHTGLTPVTPLTGINQGAGGATDADAAAAAAAAAPPPLHLSVAQRMPPPPTAAGAPLPAHLGGPPEELRVELIAQGTTAAAGILTDVIAAPAAPAAPLQQVDFPTIRKGSPLRKETPSPLTHGFLAAKVASGAAAADPTDASNPQSTQAQARAQAAHLALQLQHQQQVQQQQAHAFLLTQNAVESPSFGVGLAAQAVGTDTTTGTAAKEATPTLDGQPRMAWRRVTFDPRAPAAAPAAAMNDEFPVPPPCNRSAGGNGTSNGNGSSGKEGALHRLGRIVSSKQSAAPGTEGGRVQPTSKSAPPPTQAMAGPSLIQPASSQEAIISTRHYRPRDIPILKDVADGNPLPPLAASQSLRRPAHAHAQPVTGAPPSVLGSVLISLEEYCEAALVTPNWNERNPSMDVYLLKILPDLPQGFLATASGSIPPRTGAGADH